MTNPIKIGHIAYKLHTTTTTTTHNYTTTTTTTQLQLQLHNYNYNYTQLQLHTTTTTNMASTSTTVDCGTLSSGEVLAHLYNNSKPLGMGMFQYEAKAMSASEAEKYLKSKKHVDYCKGRPIKTSFNNYPKLDSWDFDRDNGGPGTMKSLIDQLKKTGEVSTKVPCPAPTESKLKETLAECDAALTTTSTNIGESVKSCKLNMMDNVWFIDSFC